MLASGFLISIFFDGYRVLKGRLYLPKVLVFLIDVGFGIASALFAFYLLFTINNGQIRLIIILTFVIGIGLYYITTSKYIIHVWLKIFFYIERIYRLLRNILNLIIRPLKQVIKIFAILLTFLANIFNGLFSLIRKLLPKSFKSIFRRNRKKENDQTISASKKAGFIVILKKIFRR